jgi:hypothetical protein
MRGKKELFMLITGLVLFIFDVVTDIVVAAQYRLKGEYWWFGLTLFFIIVPLFIVSCSASYQPDDRFCPLLIGCLWVVCLSILGRYVQEFKRWKQTYGDNPPCRDNYKECSCSDCEQYSAAIKKFNESAYKLACICYVETLTESAPQWCLQIYIMLRQWDFPWLTVLSAVISLLSLAWSITALEKARVSKNRHNFTLEATVVLFTSQLFNFLSRLFAIAAFAYVFKEHVLTALAVHWLMIFVAGLLMGKPKNVCGEYVCGECMCYAVELIGGSIVLSIMFIVHVPNRIMKINLIARTYYFVVFYSLLSVQNVLFAILAVTIPIPDVKHMSVLRPIVLSLIIISTVLGTILFIVYIKLFSTPIEEPHEPDEEEPREPDEEEPREPDEEEPREPDKEEPREPDEEEPREPDEEEPREPDEEEPREPDEEEPREPDEEEPREPDEEEPREPDKEENV